MKEDVSIEVKKTEEEKKAPVKKAISLKNCTYQRNFGLTQCGSAG